MLANNEAIILAFCKRFGNFLRGATYFGRIQQWTQYHIWLLEIHHVVNRLTPTDIFLPLPPRLFGMMYQTIKKHLHIAERPQSGGRILVSNLELHLQSCLV